MIPERLATPLILKGSQLPPCQGLPISQLFLATYREGVWSRVPYQWDQVDELGSFFGQDDGLLDAQDELVVDPRDFGTLALIANYGNFPGIEVTQRMELRFEDPLSGEIHALYLFYSPHPVSYEGEPRIWVEDGVLTSEAYQAWFDGQHLRMTGLALAQDGQWTQDLYDREKMRARLSLFGLPLWITEDHLETVSLLQKEGPLRIIRHIESQLEVLGSTLEFPIEEHFFPNLVKTTETVVSLDDVSFVENIRVSIDFSEAMSGAELTVMGRTPVMVDGLPDSMEPLVLTPEEGEGFWAQWEQNSYRLIVLGHFAGFAQNNHLYYHDSDSGGTADGTADTGDGLSYGDLGIQMSDFLSGGQQSASLRLCLDPEGLWSAALLSEVARHPLTVVCTAQNESDAYIQLITLWSGPHPDTPRATISILEFLGLMTL